MFLRKYAWYCKNAKTRTNKTDFFFCWGVVFFVLLLLFNRMEYDYPSNNWLQRKEHNNEYLLKLKLELTVALKQIPSNKIKRKLYTQSLSTNLSGAENDLTHARWQYVCRKFQIQKVGICAKIITINIRVYTMNNAHLNKKNLGLFRM